MVQLGSDRDNRRLPILGQYCHIQQQRVGGPVWKFEKGSVALGNDSKGVEKYGIDGLGTGDDVQEGGSDGAVLQD